MVSLDSPSSSVMIYGIVCNAIRSKEKFAVQMKLYLKSGYVLQAGSR